jgi:alkylation response protein AidB-like acyl-CoA dehydrogenase
MDRETREMLLETAERFFTERCGRDVVNGVEKGVWPADLWTEIEEMGLPLIAVPEDKGGAGGTLGDMLALLRVAGAHAVPVPLAETALANLLIAAADGDQQVGDPAIQQLLAELASYVAAPIASAEAAARDADEGGLADGGSFSIAAAKSQASEFAQRIAGIAHQSMGAMGFTHEHILHHYTRRLWVWRRDFGSEGQWGAKIGAAYAKAGPDALWASMSGSKYAA